MSSSSCCWRPWYSSSTSDFTALLSGITVTRAKYGVGVAHFILPYAYATTDHEFTRNQFIVVLITSLIVMTAVGVPVMLICERLVSGVVVDLPVGSSLD